MPRKIELVLPSPPSVNRIWRTGNGRTYKDGKAKAYALAVEAVCRTKHIRAVLFPKGVPVRYTLTWHRWPRAGDLSNRVKIVEDSLNGIVWADDAQVVECHLYRKDAAKGEQRIEITIEDAS